MLLTLKVKLLPTEEQKQQLLQTMERFNEACEFVSAYAYEHRRFGKVFLQRDLYYAIRHRFGLSAQLTVRAVGKVSESYKSERKVRHHFNKYSAVVYDERVLTFKSLDCVSILTLEGRIAVPIVTGEYARLEHRRIRGQADLVYRRGTFYLCVVVDAPEDTPITPKGCLGVDMGVTNIATTSDGIQYASELADTTRVHYQRLRSTLQRVATKSAKRHLKRVSGRERRFKTSLNHVIAKRIVQAAKDTERAIAIEDLTHIRARTTVRNAQRSRFGKWAFNQLRQFITYKARLQGIPCYAVDPRNTSKQCSVCGYVDRKNRKDQATFLCVACGYSEHADVNAAKNIASRAAVSRPIVSQPKEIQARRCSE